ncbi:glucose-6-phosphate dehydrogenase assembly protein OpcA [Kovacikia minuta]|uniref:glucose-6-phosphate dehydrogenase assembly protein OpcA n=1 Tax=Kovacikia minuta TaxID=2931930 RepID=UPI0036F3737C
MTTTSVVAPQKPKDVTLHEIEEELNSIWNHQSGDSAALIATRASTFCMVIYEPEEFQQLLAILGFYDGPVDGIHGPVTKAAVNEAQRIYGLPITGRVDPQTLVHLRQEVAKLPAERMSIANPNLRGLSVNDAIAALNPRRIITLSPTLGEDKGVAAEVSAYCPVQKVTGDNLVCSEYVNLRGTKEALNRVGDLAASLLIQNLPKFVWWKATPNPEQDLFKRVVDACNCIIMDSCYFSDPESEFIKIQELIDKGISVADLNWHRLLPWQELTAETFDPPERRADIGEIDRITIDYEKGNAAQALMFLGWIASPLEMGTCCL